MSSVEYNKTELFTGEQTVEATDYETGETVTMTQTVPKFPFVIRISKWKPVELGYELYGFVSVTEFGQTLVAQSDPLGWASNQYVVSDAVTPAKIESILLGVGAVRNAGLDRILSYGNVTPVEAEVTSDEAERFEFRVVLDGKKTFDVDWLTVDFNPSRGG